MPWHTPIVDPHFYRFRTSWQLHSSPLDVYGALEDIQNYPSWWPEVRSVRQIDDESGEVLCRSLLPYDLRFVIRQSRRDSVANVLEASMTGDLEGFSRWTITETPSGSNAVFEEEVVANKELLRRLAVVGRPAFRINHTLMMRHGNRGLATYLACKK